MKRADRRRWLAARTVGDLGELTALWLEGRIASQPGYMPGYGPDEETLHLVPCLAMLNRAGWFTIMSQPGWGPGPGYDDAIWCQRAGVSGFTNTRLADQLAAAVADAGMLVLRHEHTAARSREEIPVTTHADDLCTSFGRHWTRRQLRSNYLDCSDEAVAALCNATQLTIVDPVWGRDDVLWPLLTTAADKVRRTRTGAV